MEKSSSANRNQPSSPREFSPLGAFLSYLVPGLGQIYQGRTGKGVLFLVCLLGMFFYGMFLGQWKNVFLPNPAPLSTPTGILATITREGFPKALYYRPQFLGQFWIGVSAWPALIQYLGRDLPQQKGGFLGGFQRAPEESELNQWVRNSDKTWDLGWVYTVIAGVLNILVIYDAFAGPLFDVKKDDETAPSEATPS